MLDFTKIEIYRALLGMTLHALAQHQVSLLDSLVLMTKVPLYSGKLSKQYTKY
jgi:hypothetical protein